MLESIKNDPDLFGISRGTCIENDVGLSIDQALRAADGGFLDGRGVVLKVDAYYSPPRFIQPPPSIDCLVIVSCEDGVRFDIYLVELRNTSRTNSVRSRDIVPKFRTVAEDFVGRRYLALFEPHLRQIRRVKAYLVTDPLGVRRGGLTENEYRARILGTVLDAYGRLPPIQVLGRAVPIEPVLPDPTIVNC